MSDILKTDYKDDVIKDGEQLRKYKLISNNDGTISFEDVTDYEQSGDIFGCDDINVTNKKINEIDDNQNIKSISLESLKDSGVTNTDDIVPICEAMSANTNFTYQISTTTESYPATYGVVSITKINDGRCTMTCVNASSGATASTTFVASWRFDSGFSGWEELKVVKEHKVTGSNINLQDACNLMGISRGVFIVTAYYDGRSHSSAMVSWNTSMSGYSAPLVMSKAEYGLTTISATNNIGTIAYNVTAVLTAHLVWGI